MITRIARALSPVTRIVLYAYYRLKKPGIHGHPLAKRLCDALDYRIPCKAILPWGDQVIVALNDVIGSEIISNGCFEPDTVRLLEYLIQPATTVCDVGAHIGQYTLLASARVGPDGKVHSFEPSDVTFEWLSRNVARNERANVVLNRLALGDEPGVSTYFHAPPKNPGAGSLIDSADKQYLRTSAVAVDTLDRYVARAKLKRVDVIKIDIEGMEYRMLQGAARTLRRNRPVIVIEFSSRLRADDRSYADLADLLRSFGYQLFQVGPTPYPQFDPAVRDRFLNVVALRSSHLEELQAGGFIEQRNSNLCR